ncbi:MAG: CaiB/BaiF CoA transferase family protein [Acetobacteraceae bacterium]
MGPLSGLRIVELTTAWAGPMAGRILAFLGAEVIHVESATRLDTWRQHGQVFNPYRYPPDGAGVRPWNRVAQFNSQNVNKLSLTLDLKLPNGADVMRRLLAKSDVLLSNFTPGTLGRLGLAYDDLRAIRPDIIVVEMPAYGLTGPMAHGPAIGPTMEMASGMASMIGYPGGAPTTTGPTYLDPMGAFHGAAAVMTALLHRRRGGPGQHVEVPQVEAAMHYIGEHILHAIATGQDPEPMGNRAPWAAPHGLFPAQGDDQWIAIAVRDDAEFASLCAVMGRPDLPSDPRFATLPVRLRHQDELEAIVAGWTRGQDKHAAAERLQSEGVPAAPVNDAAEAVASPYLAHRGHFTDLPHPEIGEVPHEGLPFRLAATPGRQHRASPCLGQDTEMILRDILGLSAEEIAQLARDGTISADPA